MAILRVIVGWNHFPIALGEEPIWVASRTPWVYGWVWLCWGRDCFEFSVWWIYRAKWESSEKNCCFSLEGESVEPCAVTWLECSKTLESSSLKWQSPFRTMHFTMRMSWKKCDGRDNQSWSDGFSLCKHTCNVKKPWWWMFCMWVN